MIKRCNDFGAGGVSVAIGELAAGLEINLNAVPKNTKGWTARNLRSANPQERMAVVVAGEDRSGSEYGSGGKSGSYGGSGSKSIPRLKIFWNGKAIVDISGNSWILTARKNTSK